MKIENNIFDSKLLEQLKIQPVGGGVIDMICPLSDIDAFIDLCNAAGISIKGFTWWCHVTAEHAPCGMGGPRSKYFDGWFSEIPMGAPIALKDNEAYRDFFKKTWPCENEHRDCYWPGFWL